MVNLYRFKCHLQYHIQKLYIHFYTPVFNSFNNSLQKLSMVEIEDFHPNFLTLLHSCISSRPWCLRLQRVWRVLREAADARLSEFLGYWLWNACYRWLISRPRRLSFRTRHWQNCSLLTWLYWIYRYRDELASELCICRFHSSPSSFVSSFCRLVAWWTWRWPSLSLY